MLGIASYYDLKSREVNDIIWIVFGASGTFLYLFDVPILSHITLVGISLGILTPIFCWVLRLCGSADVLCIIVLSVILPANNDIPVTIVVLVIASVMAAVYVITVNVYKNTKSIILNKTLFSEINESVYKKLAAFFIIHQRTKNEKCEFPADSVVDGKRKFAFRHNPDTEKFGNGKYVMTTVPLMPFLMISLVFFIIMTSLLHNYPKI
jgi:preflagellin peptidase FlaK